MDVSTERHQHHHTPSSLSVGRRKFRSGIASLGQQLADCRRTAVREAQRVETPAWVRALDSTTTSTTVVSVGGTGATASLASAFSAASSSQNNNSQSPEPTTVVSSSTSSSSSSKKSRSFEESLQKDYEFRAKELRRRFGSSTPQPSSSVGGAARRSSSSSAVMGGGGRSSISSTPEPIRAIAAMTPQSTSSVLRIEQEQQHHHHEYYDGLEDHHNHHRQQRQIYSSSPSPVPTPSDQQHFSTSASFSGFSAAAAAAASSSEHSSVTANKTVFGLQKELNVDVSASPHMKRWMRGLHAHVEAAAAIAAGAHQFVEVVEEQEVEASSTRQQQYQQYASSSANLSDQQRRSSSHHHGGLLEEQQSTTPSGLTSHRQSIHHHEEEGKGFLQIVAAAQEQEAEETRMRQQRANSMTARTPLPELKPSPSSISSSRLAHQQQQQQSSSSSMQASGIGFIPQTSSSAATPAVPASPVALDLTDAQAISYALNPELATLPPFEVLLKRFVQCGELCRRHGVGVIPTVRSYDSAHPTKDALAAPQLCDGSGRPCDPPISTSAAALARFVTDESVVDQPSRVSGEAESVMRVVEQEIIKWFRPWRHEFQDARTIHNSDTLATMPVSTLRDKRREKTGPAGSTTSDDAKDRAKARLRKNMSFMFDPMCEVLRDLWNHFHVPFVDRAQFEDWNMKSVSKLNMWVIAREITLYQSVCGSATDVLIRLIDTRASIINRLVEIAKLPIFEKAERAWHGLEERYGACIRGDRSPPRLANLRIVDPVELERNGLEFLALVLACRRISTQVIEALVASNSMPYSGPRIKLRELEDNYLWGMRADLMKQIGDTPLMRLLSLPHPLEKRKRPATKSLTFSDRLTDATAALFKNRELALRHDNVFLLPSKQHERCTTMAYEALRASVAKRHREARAAQKLDDAANAILMMSSSTGNDSSKISKKSHASSSAHHHRPASPGSPRQQAALAAAANAANTATAAAAALDSELVDKVNMMLGGEREKSPRSNSVQLVQFTSGPSSQYHRDNNNCSASIGHASPLLGKASPRSHSNPKALIPKPKKDSAVKSSVGGGAVVSILDIFNLRHGGGGGGGDDDGGGGTVRIAGEGCEISTRAAQQVELLTPEEELEQQRQLEIESFLNAEKPDFVEKTDPCRIIVIQNDLGGLRAEFTINVPRAVARQKNLSKRQLQIYQHTTREIVKNLSSNLNYAVPWKTSDQEGEDIPRPRTEYFAKMEQQRMQKLKLQRRQERANRAIEEATVVAVRKRRRSLSASGGGSRLSASNNNLHEDNDDDDDGENDADGENDEDGDGNNNNKKKKGTASDSPPPSSPNSPDSFSKPFVPPYVYPAHVVGEEARVPEAEALARLSNLEEFVLRLRRSMDPDILKKTLIIHDTDACDDRVRTVLNVNLPPSFYHHVSNETSSKKVADKNRPGRFNNRADDIAEVVRSPVFEFTRDARNLTFRPMSNEIVLTTSELESTLENFVSLCRERMLRTACKKVARGCKKKYSSTIFGAMSDVLKREREASMRALLAAQDDDTGEDGFVEWLVEHGTIDPEHAESLRDAFTNMWDDAATTCRSALSHAEAESAERRRRCWEQAGVGAATTTTAMDDTQRPSSTTAGATTTTPAAPASHHFQLLDKFNTTGSSQQTNDTSSIGLYPAPTPARHYEPDTGGAPVTEQEDNDTTDAIWRSPVAAVAVTEDGVLDVSAIVAAAASSSSSGVNNNNAPPSNIVGTDVEVKGTWPRHLEQPKSGESFLFC